MRPTDENQPASNRPNLMSPRRTSGEDSILAMLEREPGRKRGAAAGGARLAWYGAGSAVALLLTGTLVWLAAGNHGIKPAAEPSMMAQAGTAPPPVAAAPAPAVRQVALATGSDTALPQSARPAVIIDQAPAGDAVPPLRLLKPAPAPAIRVPVPPAKAAAAPARPAARTASAAKPVANRAPESRQTARPSPAPARTRPALAARPPAKPAPGKPQRSRNPSKVQEAQVDADVALISAVIVHANGHAPKGSQMTELLCPNDGCKEKPAQP